MRSSSDIEVSMSLLLPLRCSPYHNKVHIEPVQLGSRAKPLGIGNMSRFLRKQQEAFSVYLKYLYAMTYDYVPRCYDGAFLNIFFQKTIKYKKPQTKKNISKINTFSNKITCVAISQLIVYLNCCNRLMSNNNDT